MKSRVVVQSSLLTSGLNRFTRALPPRGSRDPLHLAEGGALPTCLGFAVLHVFYVEANLTQGELGIGRRALITDTGITGVPSS